MKRGRLLTWTAGFLAVGLVVVALPAGAQESVFDLVTECDLLAAHPSDPNRMAEGVDDDDIVPFLTILACSEAIEGDSDEARFHFQIGRAYFAQDRNEEAMEAFQTAAKDNYALAHAYIGDMYHYGMGVPQDAGKAMQSYQHALAQGYDDAELQIEQLNFDPKKYVNAVVAALYNGDYSGVDRHKEPVDRNYLFSFVLGLEELCGSFLEPRGMVNFYLYRYPLATWAFEDDDKITVAIQTSVGERDASEFIGQHTCDGIVAKRMINSVNSYFSTSR